MVRDETDNPMRDKWRYRSRRITARLDSGGDTFQQGDALRFEFGHGGGGCH